jgi:TRAP-type C4-dicarboxylate transport system permease small subunit
MQFIAFEFLNSEDYPSRLCKIQSMAEKYVLAFLWWVILGASESYVVFKTQHMLLDILYMYLPINLQINFSLTFSW